MTVAREALAPRGLWLNWFGIIHSPRWWRADPVAALVMVPIIAREGIEGLRGRDTCNDCG